MKGRICLIIGAALAFTALAETKAALPDHDVVVVVEDAPTFAHTFTIEPMPILETVAIVTDAGAASVSFAEPLAVKPSGALSFIPVAYGLRSRCRSNLGSSDNDSHPFNSLERYRPPLRC